MQYPVSDAAERNKVPILQIITQELANTRRVLEVGSGTGQHAVHFAAGMPHLSWQPSDFGEYLAPLRGRLEQDGPANLLPPLELDVRNHPWPVDAVDGIFSANTLHIMSLQAAGEFFRGVGNVLTRPGVLCIYGPFRYGGKYTSDSNAQFDEYLHSHYPGGGIKDFESIDGLARQQGLHLTADHAMPANNQLLVWKRSAAAG
jgi:cyclopropane fatty-acyl-phospholipid synthase-like methyltransferase